MKLNLMLAALMVGAHSIAFAQSTPAADPTIGFDRLFGLGGHSCKQYDDAGRLFIYSEGMPSHSVISWLQQSDGGAKANLAMPNELVAALPLIPGCMPGKHHAASVTVDADRAGAIPQGR